MSDLQEQVRQARLTWEALSAYETRLAPIPGEIQNCPRAFQTSQVLEQSCEEALEHVMEVWHTLDAAKAHETRCLWEASKLKQALVQTKDLAFEVYKQAHLSYLSWETLELHHNGKVRQAQLASQVWEVLNVQLNCQLDEQRNVTSKAEKAADQARKQTDLAAQIMKAANDHLDQLRVQANQHEHEHNLRIEEAWEAWYEANEQAQQAHQTLVALEARLAAQTP